MTEPHQMVNVRYMVDDVQQSIDFYTKHLGFEVNTSYVPAFADVTRGHLRLLLSGPDSSADRRDAYYALDLARVREVLTATGGALHPGLRLAPARRATTRPRTATARVLFLCTGNSGRSQMAEALARARSGGAVEAHSAGSHPKPLHPSAVRVMREEHGIDLSRHRSKHLDVFADDRFDRVISLCDRVREVCPEFPGQPETVHWSMPDPNVGPDDEASYPNFRQTADELETRIEFLLAGLVDPPDPASTTPQEEP